MNIGSQSTPLTQPLVELPALQHATMLEGQNEVTPAQLPMNDLDTVGTPRKIIHGKGASASQLQQLPIRTAHLLLIGKNV